MNALKSLNKEQWVAAIAIVFSVVSLAMRFAGGIAPGSEPPPSASDRPYEAPPSRFAEFPDEKFERYSVKGIFDVQAASKLPIPSLKVPEPRDEELAAPLFRPAPTVGAYNRLQSKGARYPVLAVGQVTVSPEDLPLQAVLDELKKIEEPQAEKRPDRRNDRENEFFTVYLKSGGKPKQGTLLDEKPDHVLMRNKETGQRETWKREFIAKVVYNRTFEEQYRLDSQQIQPGPKEADERVKLAKRLVGLGMMKEAKDELGLALRARRDHLEAILLLVGLLVESADFDGAIAMCEAGIQNGAPAGELYYEIGKCLRALSFHEGAIAAFERATEHAPRHQGAKLALARAELEFGQHVQALATARDFFAKQMSSPDTTPAQKAEGFLLRGLSTLRAGDVGAARSDFEEALRVEPQNAEALNALGAAAALEGAYKEAGAKFVEAVKANQYLAEAWTNLGLLLLLGGKAAEADLIFKAAGDRDPVSADPILGQGLAALLLDKRKESAALIERAVRADPAHAAARLALGWTRLRTGEDDEALAEFTAALRGETSYLPAYSGAAAAYLRTARKMAAEAATMRDESRAAALSRVAQERRISAETLLKQVRDFDPARASSWIALGCAYASMARPDEARTAIRQAALILQAAGKSDPLISYTLGYVEYYYAPLENEAARLDSAEQEFTQGAKLKGSLADPFSVRVIAECEQAVTEIKAWRETSIRFDERFNRPTSKTVGANWLEAEDKYGIEISLENTKETGGRAKFSGKQTVAGYGMTSMTREIPGENFYLLDATLHPERVTDTEYGVSVYFSKQGDSWIGFHVGLDTLGKLRFNTSAADPRDMDRRDMMTGGGWMEIRNFTLPDPKEISIRIARGEKNRMPTFTISVWNAAKGEWVVAQKDISVGLATHRGNWKVGIFCRAKMDATVCLYVGNVRVYEKERR